MPSFRIERQQTNPALLTARARFKIRKEYPGYIYVTPADCSLGLISHRETRRLFSAGGPLAQHDPETVAARLVAQGTSVRALGRLPIISLGFEDGSILNPRKLVAKLDDRNSRALRQRIEHFEKLSEIAGTEIHVPEDYTADVTLVRGKINNPQQEARLLELIIPDMSNHMVFSEDTVYEVNPGAVALPQA